MTVMLKDKLVAATGAGCGIGRDSVPDVIRREPN